MRKRVDGLVYFVRGADLVKIGYTMGDPHVRLQSLQIGSPVKLELVGVIVGGVPVEEALHARFAEFRSHGEWFRADPVLLAFIETDVRPWAQIAERFRPGGRRTAFADRVIKALEAEQLDVERRRKLAERLKRPPKETLEQWAQRYPITIMDVFHTAAEWAELKGMTLEEIREWVRDVLSTGGTGDKRLRKLMMDPYPVAAAS